MYGSNGLHNTQKLDQYDLYSGSIIYIMRIADGRLGAMSGHRHAERPDPARREIVRNKRSGRAKEQPYE